MEALGHRYDYIEWAKPGRHVEETLRRPTSQASEPGAAAADAALRQVMSNPAAKNCQLAKAELVGGKCTLPGRSDGTGRGRRVARG